MLWLWGQTLVAQVVSTLSMSVAAVLGSQRYSRPATLFTGMLPCLASSWSGAVSVYSVGVEVMSTWCLAWRRWRHGRTVRQRTYCPTWWDTADASVRPPPAHSDLWFDKDRRAAKHLTRRLERAYSAATSTASANSDSADAVAKADAAKTTWLNQCRTYCQLRQTKSAECWNDKMEANQSDLHKLWGVVDNVLGRSRTPATSDIDVEVFNRFCLLTRSPKYKLIHIILAFRSCITTSSGANVPT